jgi:HEPN domain-containing protein
VNRNDLRELALIRLREARTLLGNGQYEGAYYLSGYVVECALKACIAKQTKRYDFPDRKTTDGSYTHDVANLLKTAKLDDQRRAEMRVFPKFTINWNVVNKWSVQSRYTKPTKVEAEALYSAITERRHGVLPWIRRRW